MKKLVAPIVLWTAALLMPLPAAAQITNYEGVLGSQEYLDFLGGSGVVSPWTEQMPNGAWSQVYVGPYVGRFATNGVTSPSFSLVCVDFEHFAGDQWVNVTSLGSGQSDAGLANTRLGAGTGSLDTYRRAAYLSSLFESWEDYGTSKSTVWSGIHAAIWTITSGAEVGGDAVTRDYFLHLADTEGATYAADGWYVLSGVDGRYQEMLVRTNTVPEPSTWLLMGTGLALLLVFGRGRMRKLDEVA